MTQTLRIQFKDGTILEYRYEDGLEAVCETLETQLYSEFSPPEIEVIVES